jgi:GntR family transcriptional repressor for pyruvate dehydrogenase complex
LDEYTKADLAFHYRLAQVTQNSMIIKVHELISEILDTAMWDLIHRIVGKKNGPVYHRKIIDAIKQKNKAKCETLMEEHIEQNLVAIRQHGKSD